MVCSSWLVCSPFGYPSQHNHTNSERMDMPRRVRVGGLGTVITTFTYPRQSPAPFKVDGAMSMSHLHALENAHAYLPREQRRQLCGASCRCALVGQ